MRSLGVLAVLVALVASVVCVEKARFDHYRVYSVPIETEEQLRQLQQIDSHPNGYELWEYPSAVGITIPVMVPPHKRADFAELTANWANVRLEIENLQEKFDEEQPKVMPRMFGWDSYHTLAEIYEWLDVMAYAHSSVARTVVGGVSHEGREIKGLRISHKSGNPGVFIEAGIHAREWIADATATFIINELLTSTNPDIQDIARNYDWYIFPVVNPDGYEYSHTTNRNWRKTRKPSSSVCYGADANRNWGYNWNQGGVSTNPCSDTFLGTAPFSEVETKSLSDYYSSLSGISTYISFHSYGQMLLVPFGHTRDRLGNYYDLVEIGGKAVEKLAERFGTRYTYGNIAETIYIASGGSIDWVKGVKGTGLVYCYELRDTGRYGFSLPANQIRPTGQETLDSIVVILREGANKGYH
ncbi:zinc carboxypeptidase-like [Phlebotomus argentipes]|uniref:zinc carboxypeptidase-like n=1 Tax=Phlebotomus argentipes TaxID=94469 RepID=UPI002893309C|nr:zinc carboxypeptidase-like [Phlebotomus argentipes]